MDFQTYAVLPAAGCGERTSLPVPKQFCLVAGRPLITYTLERFERLPWMKEIYVAISADWKEYMQELIAQCKLSKIRLVEGSTTRHRSIRNCIEELNHKLDKETKSSAQEVVVIVHDAVRPFVDEETLRRIAIAAKEHGASGAIRPLVSTIIASDVNGILDHSLVRSKYRESHTPQAFTHNVIKTAYDKMTDADLDYGTECLHLALEYTGTKAKLIEAPDEVWKVTYRKDFFAADFLATENFSLVGIVTSEDSAITKHLLAALKETRLQVGPVCTEVTKLSTKANCIIIHKINPTIDTISHTCNQAVEFLERNCSCGGVITCIVSDIVNSWQQLHSLAQQMVADLKQIVLYFVILNKKDHIADDPARLVKASSMVASLVYNRNQHLSGQVFLL